MRQASAFKKVKVYCGKDKYITNPEGSRVRGKCTESPGGLPTGGDAPGLKG